MINVKVCIHRYPYPDKLRGYDFSSFFNGHTISIEDSQSIDNRLLLKINLPRSNQVPLAQLIVFYKGLRINEDFLKANFYIDVFHNETLFTRYHNTLPIHVDFTSGNTATVHFEYSGTNKLVKRENAVSKAGTFILPGFRFPSIEELERWPEDNEN